MRQITALFPLNRRITLIQIALINYLRRMRPSGTKFLRRLLLNLNPFEISFQTSQTLILPFCYVFPQSSPNDGRFRFILTKSKSNYLGVQ